jgi:hypothetical protein
MKTGHFNLPTTLPHGIGDRSGQNCPPPDPFCTIVVLWVECASADGICALRRGDTQRPGAVVFQCFFWVRQLKLNHFRTEFLCPTDSVEIYTSERFIESLLHKREGM